MQKRLKVKREKAAPGGVELFPFTEDEKGKVFMKFGLFNTHDEEASQVFEGDFMQMQPPYSIIYKYTENEGRTIQTGSIHLAPGQSVRLMTEDPQRFFDPRVPDAWR